MPINLTPKDDWAKYLPAISSFYVKILHTFVKDPTSTRDIAGFPNGLQGLNFLNPDTDIFHYNCGLYSAGHAKLDLAKADNVDVMIQQRDRSATTIVGDSGGFQIATGVLKLDWANVKGPSGDKLRESILRWLEHTADWSMTLDVPAFAAEPPLNVKTGLDKFEDTLDITLHNLDYFVRNRVIGATKFLNVLSGSSVETSKTWYDAVKVYSDPNKVTEMGFERERTLEGYAFAGINMRNMYSTLSRMLDLIDDGLIKDKDWIHFLGIGRIDWGCYLTSIQRQLRKHYNPNVTVSYDAASPFVATAYGKCYNYNYFNPRRWGYGLDWAVDDKRLSTSDLQMPFHSEIMRRLQVKDVCPYDDDHAIINGVKQYDVTESEVEEMVKQGVDAVFVPATKNRIGRVGKTSWDMTSYLLYMAHNVYNHIIAVQEANRLLDIERQTIKIDYRDWSVNKRISNISVNIPNNILFFDKFVETLLDPACPNPRQLLDAYKPMLDSISFGNVRQDSFNSLFDTADAGVTDMDSMADLNDRCLTELENKIEDEE